MSARTRRLLTSSWAALFVFSLLMQYGALAAPATTLAVHNDGLFELDRNAVTQTSHDWDQVYNDVKNGTSTSGASHVQFITDAINSTPDEHLFTGGGSKDEQPISAWKWTTGAGVQDKNDIEHAYAAAYTSAAGHRIVYFGQDRYAQSGDAFVGFWFLKGQVGEAAGGTFSGAHQNGDVLVQVNFTNGGVIQDFLISHWNNGALVQDANGVDCLAAGTPSNDFACGVVNQAEISSPWPYTPKSGTANNIPAGGFFEAGIDLTNFGLADSCFSTFVSETRSSQSLTSTLSDYALGGFSFCNPPALTTTATPGGSMTIGSGTQHDVATLSGANGPVTGTVTFFVCGPSASNPDCSTGGTQVGSPVTIASGSATSANVTPTAVGSYCFRAEYAPDQASSSKYLPTSETNQGSECFTVNKAQPSISTSAAETVDVGQVIHDSASLSGGVDPTGTITFSLYGPNDASCSSAAIFTTTASVSGNGSYGPVSFTTTAAGTYRWIASYGGDASNKAAAGACNDTGENDVANKVTPSIATTASGSVMVGGTISDTATVSGGFAPTGTVSFALYGPADPTCAAPPIFTSVDRPLSGGTASSAVYTTTQAGTYHWIASYSGDGNNNAVAGACGDANESVVVTKSPTTIVTSATEGGIQGTAISDTATVTGFHPTGNVTFKLYGPSDQSCTGSAIFTSTGALDPNGHATSGSFTVQTAGVYHWIASYAGDGNNDPVSGACGDTGETTTISQFAPTISTVLTSGQTTGAKISVLFGSSVTDQATLTGAGPTAGGTVQYRVFSDNACTTQFANAGTKTVVNGAVPASDGITFPTAGTYYWQAHYSGDANNAPATSACQDEVITVTTPDLTAEKVVSVNGGPSGHSTTAQPGDTLTYMITVSNSGDGAALNVPISDDINPILAHASFVGCSDGCTNTAGVLAWMIPSIAANGGSKIVTFTVTLAGTFPVGVTTLPNTVVVTGPGSNCAAGTSDPACSTTTTVSLSTLTIAKSFTGNTLPPLTTAAGTFQQAAEGDTLTYSLAYVITNPPVHNGVITDVLPAGQTYVSGSAAGNDEFTFKSYDSTTRTLTWTAAVVSKNGSVTYRVTIDTGASGLTQPLTNTATIKSDETAPNSATASVFVPAPPLAITQPPTDTLPTPQPGNPGFSLMLLLLGLAGFALALGFVTPVPERVRRRDRD